MNFEHFNGIIYTYKSDKSGELSHSKKYRHRLTCAL